ncbi:MAG TPA: PQQ-binding-like beta-propeller repeat protein [Pyrinomonadaceae bacterium]|nr:PQQ-binding-like beta-propeller repeat protein [Pyrinomonadaceae bacterium]
MSQKNRIYLRRNILGRLCLLFALLIFSPCVQSRVHADKVSEKGLTFSAPLTIRWQFDSKNTTSLSPTSNSGYLYLPLTSGEIVSLNVSNGQLLWRTEIGGNFSASPIADERGVYLASRNEDTNNSRQILRSTGAIRALSQSTGITLWMRTLHFPLQGGLISSATKLFGGSADGRVYAFNKATGEILWVFQHTSAFSSYPALHNGRLYIGSEDGTLLSLDETSGAALWRYRTRGALRGTVAAGDNIIFFGSNDGYVYAYSELDGRLLWRRRTGAAVQAVVLTGSGIVATSLDNFVYLLSPRRGELIWKRQLAGRIAALPLIDTRSALFAPLGGDACVVLSLRDGKQLNTLPVGEEGNTGATPLVAGNLLLIPTRRGLTAFAPTSDGAP